MLKVTCLKVANEISSLQFKLAPSAWCEISLVISIHVIFLHFAYVDNQPEIDGNDVIIINWFEITRSCHIVPSTRFRASPLTKIGALSCGVGGSDLLLRKRFVLIYSCIMYGIVATMHCSIFTEL